MQSNDTDLCRLQECFSKHGTERSLGSLRWQYFSNPVGCTLVEYALSDDTLAAIYALQPCWFRIQGQRTLAVQSVDTLVDQEFRGKGLFFVLARRAYNRAFDANAKLVFGFPNAHSAPGFFKGLRWSPMDPVPFLFRPLSARFLLSKLSSRTGLRQLPDIPIPIVGKRLPSEFRLQELGRLGFEFDTLWSSFSSQIGCTVDRDSVYMNWRLEKPDANYRRLGIWLGQRLVSFCAWRVVNKHGGRLSYILELMYLRGFRRCGLAVLAEALRQSREQGAEACIAWCFQHSPNIGAFHSMGFVPIPERIRPIELHFGARSLLHEPTDMLLNRQAWYLSYCDSDTV